MSQLNLFSKHCLSSIKPRGLLRRGNFLCSAGFNQTRSVQPLEKMNGISQVPWHFLLKWMKDTWDLLKIADWAFRDPAVFQHCVLGVCSGEPEEMDTGVKWTLVWNGHWCEMDIGVPFSGAIQTPTFSEKPHVMLDLLRSIWFGSLARSNFSPHFFYINRKCISSK